MSYCGSRMYWQPYVGFSMAFPLGDTQDDHIAKCQADATAKTADMDAQTEDLAKTWQFTGYLSSLDIRTIAGYALSLVRAGTDAIDRALASSPLETQVSILKSFRQDLYNDGLRALDFLDAAQKADAGNYDMVYVPDFKKWVLKSLNDASDGIAAGFVATCVTPDALDDLAMTIYSWAGFTVVAAKKAVNFIYDAGKRIYNAAKSAFDILAWIADHWKLLAIAGTGVWIWNKTQKRK